MRSYQVNEPVHVSVAGGDFAFRPGVVTTDDFAEQQALDKACLASIVDDDGQPVGPVALRLPDPGPATASAPPAASPTADEVPAEAVAEPSQEV